MPRKFTPTEIDHAVHLRHTGKSFSQIARELGRASGETVRVAFKFRGIETTPTRTYQPPNAIPMPDDLRARYDAGESVLSMAESYGVSRTPVMRWLAEAGLPVRSMSEAQRLRIAASTPEQRAAWTEAAHTAIRGRAMPDHQVRNMAAARERAQYGGPDSLATRRLCERLDSIGIAYRREKAVGRYNVDVAIPAANIAVEVLGGNWHASKPIHATRTPYILGAGWNMLFIWDTKQVPIGDSAVEYLVAYAQETSADPSAARQYRVIRGDGKLTASGSADDHDFTLVAPSRSRLNTRRLN